MKKNRKKLLLAGILLSVGCLITQKAYPWAFENRFDKPIRVQIITNKTGAPKPTFSVPSKRRKSISIGGLYKDACLKGLRVDGKKVTFSNKIGTIKSSGCKRFRGALYIKKGSRGFFVDNKRY